MNSAALRILVFLVGRSALCLCGRLEKFGSVFGDLGYFV